MYLVKVATEQGPRFNIVRGCGGRVVTLNPEPFRNENMAFIWMHKFSSKIIKEDSNGAERHHE